MPSARRRLFACSRLIVVDDRFACPGCDSVRGMMSNIRASVLRRLLSPRHTVSVELLRTARCTESATAGGGNFPMTVFVSAYRGTRRGLELVQDLTHTQKPVPWCTRIISPEARARTPRLMRFGLRFAAELGDSFGKRSACILPRSIRRWAHLGRGTLPSLTSSPEELRYRWRGSTVRSHAPPRSNTTIRRDGLVTLACYPLLRAASRASLVAAITLRSSSPTL